METLWVQRFDRFTDQIRAELAAHEERDGAQFADLRAGHSLMNEKLAILIEQRAEAVGEARAIAKRNTWLMAIVSAIPAIVTVCIQKHWLGF